MMYFPDTNKSSSWSNKTLGALGYNSNPDKFQEIKANLSLCHPENKYYRNQYNTFPYVSYIRWDR